MEVRQMKLDHIFIHEPLKEDYSWLRGDNWKRIGAQLPNGDTLIKDIITGYNDGGENDDVAFDLDLDPETEEINRKLGGLRQKIFSVIELKKDERGGILDICKHWGVTPDELETFYNSKGKWRVFSLAKATDDLVARGIIEPVALYDRLRKIADVRNLDSSDASLMVTISKARARAGLTKYEPVSTEEQRRRVAPLKTKGLTIKEIVAETGYTEDVVYNSIEHIRQNTKLKVPPRPTQYGRAGANTRKMKTETTYGALIRGVLAGNKTLEQIGIEAGLDVKNPRQAAHQHLARLDNLFNKFIDHPEGLYKLADRFGVTADELKQYVKIRRRPAYVIKDEVRKLLQQGVTDSEKIWSDIVAQLTTNRLKAPDRKLLLNLISKVKREMGMATNNYFTQEQIDAVITMRKQKQTYTQISAATGIRPGAISRIIGTHYPEGLGKTDAA